jgi:hypothetical protein
LGVLPSAKTDSGTQIQIKRLQLEYIIEHYQTEVKHQHQRRPALDAHQESIQAQAIELGQAVQDIV